MSDQILRAGTELDALVPELWSGKFYDNLLSMLPFQGSVARDYEGEISKLGDTVNISVFPQFAIATILAEDEKNDADAVTVTKSQLVVNKQIVKDFIITDIAMIQALDSQMKLQELAVHAVRRQMEYQIISNIVPNAAAPDHSIAYSSGTTLALADILAGKLLLDNQNVSPAGRKMVSNPDEGNDLFNISGFQSNDFINGANGLSSGLITVPLLGFDVSWTTEINDHKTFLFHSSFMQMAIQKAPQLKAFDLGLEGKRAFRFNITALMGLKQVDGLRVVSIG